jgi:hypothetical protein
MAAEPDCAAPGSERRPKDLTVTPPFRQVQAIRQLPSDQLRGSGKLPSGRGFHAP